MKFLVSHGISLSECLNGDFRWSAYAWEYECTEAEHFKDVGKTLNVNGRYDPEDPEGFAKFKGCVFAAMVLALSDLVADGCFGTGETRNSITLFCSVPSSECTQWLEEESARVLNPPKLFKVFQEQRIKYITDDSNSNIRMQSRVYLNFSRHLCDENQSHVSSAIG